MNRDLCSHGIWTKAEGKQFQCEFILPTKGTTPYLNTGITPFIRDNH